MTSDKSQKKSKTSAILNYILSFALTIIFLYVAFHDVDFSEVLTIVGKADLFWIFVFVVVSMLAHYLRALRWKYILNSVKSDVSIKNLFGALMIGYGVNCVTPKLGELTRAVLLGKWEGLSRSSMFGTVVLERVLDVVTFGISILIALYIASVSLTEKFPWLITSLYITAVIIIALVFILIFILKSKEKFSLMIVKFLGRFSPRAADRIAYIFTMLAEGFTSLKGIKNYFWTFCLTILITLLYALSSYIGFLMFGLQNIQPLTFGMGWIIMSISSIGTLIPTPGSAGSYHALAKSTMVLIFGFTETIGAAYAFLTHIIGYFLFIITALVMFILLNKQKVNIFKVVETEINDL